jgi:energy-converting hydrogenase Eha subunit E
MLGVGAGLAVGGALFGTLAPQTLAASASLIPSAGGPVGAWVNVLILISTVTTLVAFAYSRSVQRSAVGRIGALGRGLLHVAFGATFALVFIAGASVLSAWLRDFFLFLNSPGG